MIITRTEPPLPLGRMRALGEMIEIRLAELRFGSIATAALVHAVAGAVLSDADVASLVQRSEGWPAGLYLAALSLRGHESLSFWSAGSAGRPVDPRVPGRRGAHPAAGRSPPVPRADLDLTGYARRCARRSGPADSAAIISVIERENLFVVPLDQNRRWFRDHNLFAEVLHSQLTATEPDPWPRCTGGPAPGTRSGSAEEAIRHSLAAGDAETVIGLIAEPSAQLRDSGRMATVSGWLHALGNERIAASPLAAHCAMWVGALPAISGRSGAGRLWSRPRGTTGRCRTACGRARSRPR